MKIIVTIEAEVDGRTPTDEEILDAVGLAVPGVYLSDDIGKPGEWALPVKTVEVEVVK